MQYYKVQAKCGHVGRNNYILKWFYVKADDGEEAAKIVRNKPRVKHHNKNAINAVEKISKEEYLCGIRCNQEDKYFQSHSSTEQRFLNAVLYEEILPEEKVEHYKKKQAKRQLKYAILEKEWVKSSRRY